MSQKQLLRQQKELLKLYKEGNFKDIIQKSKRLLVKDSKNIFLYNIVGGAFISLGEYERAIECMNSILNIDNTFADAHYNKGHALNAMERVDEAINSYKRALEIDSNSTEVLFALGNIFSKIHQYQDAMIYYAKVLQINPEYAQAHYNIGDILRNAKRYQEAISFYTHAIQIKPTYIEAYNNLGLTLTEINKNKDAILYYKKALEINPYYSIAYHNIGNSLSHLRKYREAIDYYQQAICLSPHYLQAYNNLANAFQENAQLNEAVLNFKQALKIDPNYTEAIANLMLMFIQLDKRENIQQLNEAKNSIMYKIYFIISSFMDESFEQTQVLIGAFKKEMEEELFLHLSDNNKNFALAYITFIDRLNSSALEKTNLLPTNTAKHIIYHIGESHSLSFAHKEITLKNKTYTIKPLIIFGAKAWHLNTNKTNRFKAFFENHIHRLEKGSSLILSFGEIDCRADEGIIHYHLKTKLDLNDIVYQTVRGYIDYTEEILDGRDIKRLYMGIPAPVISESKNMQEHSISLTSLSSLRVDVIKLFNMNLIKILQERELNFLDVYKLTANDAGISNLKYMCDDFHLDPSALKYLNFENL